MTASSLSTTPTQLQAQAKENPELAEAIDYYLRVGPALVAAGERIPPAAISAKTAEEKFSAGIPLLVGEELNIDPALSRDIFLSLCEALRPPAKDDLQRLALQKIISGVESGDLDPLPLLSAVSSNEAGLVEEMSARHGLDPRLVNLLVQNTLKAFLRAWRAGLEKLVDLEGWRRSLCPFCGSPPTLAEAVGVERARRLRCLRCGAGWPYPNLQCAFCGNDAPYTLGVISIESDFLKYYANTCEHCRRYIKTVVTFDAIPENFLMVEDLATLHLDRLARERGYG